DYGDLELCDVHDCSLSVLDGQKAGRVLDENLGDGGLINARLSEVGDELLEDVVDRVALDPGPAERAAVRIRRREHLVEVAGADEAEEVVEAVFAGARRDGRVGQFGLVAEGVKTDAATLLCEPGVARLVEVDSVVDVAEENAVEVEALFFEDRERVLGVDREVSQ